MKKETRPLIFVCAYCATEEMRAVHSKYSKLGVKYTHGICRKCLPGLLKSWDDEQSSKEV